MGELSRETSEEEKYEPTSFVQQRTFLYACLDEVREN